ncbi:MAG: AAA family ATPase [Pseudonocardiaceae bacterium]|nr:AAA family ATPase [Pseudonocardiaceae bacterium]
MVDVPRIGSGIPLVARTAEMRQLRAALERAGNHEAGAVLLSGDAGVGKTRLVTEFAKRAEGEGALVLTGRCLDVREAGLPYLPFAEALGTLTGAEAESLRGWPTLGRLLPQLNVSGVRPAASDVFAPGQPDMPGSSAAEQDVSQLQVFDAVFGLLEKLATGRTVLLVIEDLHWADSATRNLLSFVLSRLRSQGLLVLATYRADDLHRRHPLRAQLAELVRLPKIERIELAPFDTDEIRRFVSALAERPLDDAHLRSVMDRSEGNAFFAEELLTCYTQSADGLPATLADVLLARLERLSPAAQSVVRVASVAGRSATDAQLASVAATTEAELDEALREAVQHHVLVAEQGRYAFRHALLREAVYQDLLPGERTRLHASYAAALTRQPNARGNAAMLAYHCVQSNDLAGALAASVRAADEADGFGAPAEALRHLEQALSVWDAVDPDQRGPHDHLELLVRASWTAAKVGQPERSLAFVEAAIEALSGTEVPERAARVWRRRAQALGAFDGREQEADEAIRRAWQLVANGSPGRERARVHASYAAFQRVGGQPAEARQSAQDAIADAREVGSGGAEADALTTLALLDGRQGDIEGARAGLREAVRIAAASSELTAELRAWCFLAMTFYDRGQLAEAARTVEEGSLRARTTGLTWSTYGLELQVLRILIRYAGGEWQDSGSSVSDERMSMSSLVSGRVAAAGLQLLVGRGQFDEAETVLGQLRPQWQLDMQIALLIGCAGAESALWQGDPSGAATHVDEAIDWLEQFQPMALGGVRLAALGLRACAELASAARRASNVDAEKVAITRGERLYEHAMRAVRNGRPWAGGMGPEGLAWLARLEAEAAGLRGMDPLAWRKAVDAFGYGAVYERAICRLRYAEALLGSVDRGTGDSSSGDSGGHSESGESGRTELAEQLGEAASVAESLGAVPLRDAVHRLARRARITVPGEQRPAARDTVDPLTPRERSVLALVARGRTNREAGVELYISEKTVSVHLSRVMSKLGASRRSEAVAIASERGLLDER